MTVFIGPYTAGEIPEPLVYTFLDNTGAPIDLHGYTAEFLVRHPDGTTATYDADVTDATAGQVTFVWQTDTLAAAGLSNAEFWVDDTLQRFASDRVRWYTRRAIVAPVPS